ncbi:MAG: glycosyltransferase family 4 protein [Chloroflexi bacterium]|nr:glycosyltransferase family 4 protein [Chloroflexota bacterium]
MTALNQVIIGATRGDAITDEAFIVRRWVREMGFASEIFAQYIDPALEDQVRPVTTWRPQSSDEWLIYHHSIGSSVADLLMAASLKLILIYHNVTPPEFFTTINPALNREMIQGREQLLALRSHTRLALADSAFNETDLVAAGFCKTGVLPIALDEGSINLPANQDLLARYGHQRPSLLFVGRQVPNKKQEDLLKLLYFYRRVEPRARLFLVGDAWMPAYAHWLRNLTIDLDLDDAVVFVGKTSQQDLVTYYQLADVYVSMSEHEGFGKPLIESMYLGLPVLAYAAAAVPGTLGDAGVQFHCKDYEALAEVLDVLVRDDTLRHRITAHQRVRVKSFLEPQVRQTWQTFLGDLFE